MLDWSSGHGGLVAFLGRGRLEGWGGGKNQFEVFGSYQRGFEGFSESQPWLLLSLGLSGSVKYYIDASALKSIAARSM